MGTLKDSKQINTKRTEEDSFITTKFDSVLGWARKFSLFQYPFVPACCGMEYQGGHFFGVLPKWGAFFQPLGCIVFLFAAMAETKRVPFDLPEGESEIIGFFTEYSGLKWGLFMMTDFMEIIVVSCILTTLFFGGWQVPWLAPEGFIFPWGGTWMLSHGVVVFLQVLAFNIKVFFFCWLQILFRWTYPRFRYDQVMNFGWKLLIPLCLANIIITGIFMSI